MPVYSSVRDHGTALCEQAGYDVVRASDLGEPPATATPTPDAVGLVDEPRQIAVEPLTEADIGPAGIVPRFAAALCEDRDCLFVVPAQDGGGTTLARLVAAILSEPSCLAEAGPTGRHFYKGPDRVLLSDGTRACARAPRAELQWREIAVGADRPRLELAVGTELIAVFEHVDALADAGRHAFQHAYRRSEDGQFEVTANGEVVERFSGPTAMRRAGYTPVPMPLVPEHLFPEGADRTRWAVCQPDDTRSVLTASGRHDWE
jgi:hypothetical protein